MPAHTLAAFLRARAVHVVSGLALTLAGGCSSPEPEPAATEAVEAAWEVIVPVGLGPDLQAPPDNPMTREKVELGRALYYDGRLSKNGDVSCATCHDPDKGFTDQMPVSTGHEGQKGARSAPPVTNATYSYVQFWDGRAATLEDQALGPIQNPIEMANTMEGTVATIAAIPGYGRLFEAAYGDPAVTPERIAQAIASFERTVLSGTSRWDRYMAGDPAAMSEAEIRGWDLFRGKAQCTLCHAGQTFSDSDFHNLGVGMAAAEPDLGRFAVTGDDADRGAFKTPMLRDVTLTAPYMHDGSQATLEEVIDFYNRGGEPNPWLDPKIRPLGLTAQEAADLAAFLRALDGEIPNDVGPPAALP
jgi:cytochrome c peroxidase